MIGCGSAKAPEVKVPTPQAYQPLKNFEMVMNEENFLRSTVLVINQVSFYEPEIGKFLSLCEIAVSDGIDSLHGILVTKNRTCIIALIRNQDLMDPSGLWYQFAGSNGNFVVAATTDLQGADYPLIVVPEGEFDLAYYIRVFAHEGLHASRMKTGADCQDPEDKVCMINEEVMSYKIQFKVLEAQKMDGSFQVPEKISRNNNLALGMEQDLYNQFKQGQLADYLTQIGYGN